MIKSNLQIGFSTRLSIFIIGLVAFFAIVYIAQDILIPIVFSILIAIVLHPIVAFLNKKGLGKILAISLTLFLSVIIMAALGLLFFTQASEFSKSWPILVERFTALLNDSISNTAQFLNINPQSIHDRITLGKEQILNTSSANIGQALLSLGNVLAILMLMPVYVFLILYYKTLLIEFVRRLFPTEKQKQLNEVIAQVKTVIQGYLVGLSIEIVILTAMNSIALLILGIQYAVLLGFIGALFNLIPYIGGLIGVAIPMMIAIVTKDNSWYALYILGIYYVIQLIDNNFIVPKIVASKVKLNALFSIMAVIIGNALWGVAGMFLAIPILAIVKLICDHVEILKPWGYLLGDNSPIVNFKLKKSKV